MKPPETVYRGERIMGPGGSIIGVRVTVNGRELKLPPSLRVWNHSPTGFEWGYCGSGPAQLALALVLDATGDRELATQSYQWFKVATVACWGEKWQITAGEIHRWLEQWERENPLPEPEKTQAERMRDPAYVPSLTEALADPDGFVEGMTEFRCTSTDRRCRVCGCTDRDCRQCIAVTGYPCRWVEDEADLCTRCAAELVEEGGGI